MILRSKQSASTIWMSCNIYTVDVLKIALYITIEILVICSYLTSVSASQVALVVKNLPASAGDIRDTGSIPGWGRSPGGGGHGNPLQYSCLENPMDREAWWAPVHAEYWNNGNQSACISWWRSGRSSSSTCEIINSRFPIIIHRMCLK